MTKPLHLIQQVGTLALMGWLTASGVGAQVAAGPEEETDQPRMSNGPSILRGFAVTELSGSIGGYAFRAPTESGGIGPSSLLISGASTAEAGWFLPGERSDFFLRYRATYTANDLYSTLNGFDHTLSLGWRKDLTPRLVLVVGGMADSVLYADYLFSPLSALSAVGSSGTLDQLSGSLATAPAVGASPLGYAIFGARRIDLTSSATLDYLLSPRSTWKVDGAFLRSLPELNSTTRSLSPSTPVLAISDARAGISYGYAVSQRTTIGFATDYDDIGSSVTKYQTGSARFTMEHRFTPDFFVQGGAGVGLVNKTTVGGSARYYDTYVWNAGAGLKHRNQTFLASVRREVADAYGLGAASTFTLQVAGIYHRPDSPWTFELSGGYESLSGLSLGPVEGWLAESSMSRRLTPRTRFSIQGVYGNDYGFTLGPLTGVPRKGVKVSYIFTPGSAELVK